MPRLRRAHDGCEQPSKRLVGLLNISDMLRKAVDDEGRQEVSRVQLIKTVLLALLGFTRIYG